MKEVYDFNQKRNKFKLDHSLESAMLKEEIQEFYDATTLAERIDAMIDVRYVFEGTQMKFNFNMVPLDEQLNKVVAQFHRISTTIVAQELGDNSQYLDKIMDKAWDIVCKVNELKLSYLDNDGKVIKESNHPDATAQIAELLSSVIDSNK